MSLIQASDIVGNDDDDGYTCILYRRGYVERIGNIYYKLTRGSILTLEVSVSYPESAEITELLKNYVATIARLKEERQQEYTRGLK